MKRKVNSFLALTSAAAVAISSLFVTNPFSKVVASESGDDIPKYSDLKVGEDFKDLNAEIKFLTHRTDLVENGTFSKYLEKFSELYPGITVNYEAITDYAESVTTRLTNSNWGDVSMIPTTIPMPELGDYYYAMTDLADIENDYNFADNRAYDGKVYGIPSTANAQGIVYNKRVFKEAGIDELPKTPEAFLESLKKIKEHDSSIIPLYTNYAAGWTMSAWDAYIGGGATGDTEFMSMKIAQMHDPFKKAEVTGDEQSGPYAVYNILYEAVKRGLTEEDPTTTDWEGSKSLMNQGKIATMVLGSWAVVQMQEAGENAKDIGYMPFPIEVKGKQYASAGADYCYGINVNSSKENKIAAMLYIKWLTESSNFSYDQGGIPILKGEEYPDSLLAFEGVELLADKSAPKEYADLGSNVQREAELALNSDQTHVMRIVEAAINGDETIDDIVADWNNAWNQAVDQYANK